LQSAHCEVASASQNSSPILEEKSNKTTCVNALHQQIPPIGIFSNRPVLLLIEGITETDSRIPPIAAAVYRLFTVLRLKE
jgi:hypothetical protein